MKDDVDFSEEWYQAMDVADIGELNRDSGF